MFKAKNLIFLSIFVLLVGCSGGDDDSINAVEVTISSSNEEPNYNETYTISWESNASQCYAQSITGSWLGELEPSGSQDFVAKREGLANYGLQCRTSINFASASTDIEVQKDFVDYFDFTNAESFNIGSLTFNSDSDIRVLDNSISDFNQDFRLDLIMLIEDERTPSAGDSEFYILVFYGQDPELITDENPYSFVEINNGNCVADMLVRNDYNFDSAPDLMTVSSSHEDSQGKRGICFFISTPDGLVLQDEDYLINDTVLDLSAVNVGSQLIYDLTTDGRPDVFMMGNGGSTDLPFYIVPSESGPSIQLSVPLDTLNPYTRSNGCNEGLVFLCDWIANDYQFKSSVLISADSDGVLDLVHSISTIDGGQYNLYNTRLDNIYFDFSAPILNFINRSISDPNGYAVTLEAFDANLDGNLDLFSVEKNELSNIFKFNFYEKIISSEDETNELSATNNGSFLEEFIFNDGFAFTNEILTFDVNFDGLQDIFSPYTELPFKTDNAQSEKHFLAYEKSYITNEDESITQDWITQDFSESIGINGQSVSNSWVDFDMDNDIDVVLIIPEVQEDSSVKYNFEIYLNNSLF